MVTAGIASIPQREDCLKSTLKSIRNQVDLIFVSLNGYEHTPPYLKFMDNVSYTFSDNRLGDAMKFIYAGKVSGYFIGIDDDIIYPTGYVDYMISKCNEYNCPVSLHGKTFSYPVENYHQGFTRNFHCRSQVIGDHHVDVIGTGVCCFKTSQLVISIDDFLAPNMADLWFALAAKRQGSDLMVVEHSANWIGYMEQPWTIWRNKPRNGEETKIINEILKPR